MPRLNAAAAAPENIVKDRVMERLSLDLASLSAACRALSGAKRPVHTILNKFNRCLFQTQGAKLRDNDLS
jgi:hypothetical protein